jgi:hypothetical protein
MLIVEEEERQVRQRDYFHCPPNTRHIFVGAGDGPFWVSMLLRVSCTTARLGTEDGAKLRPRTERTLTRGSRSGTVRLRP